MFLFTCSGFAVSGRPSRTSSRYAYEIDQYNVSIQVGEDNVYHVTEELNVHYSYGAAYTLNVSSPGLDRPFKTARDFERNLGKEVEVKLFAPLKGKKFFEGVLSAFDNNSVTITIGGAEEKIAKNKIAKINKAIKFD